MENERYTEDLVMKEMRSYLGKNDWGYIYPKTVEKHNKITRCLQKAGGKPDICDIKDYTKGGTGKAQPEYIITFDEKLDTIIVVECKRSITYHRSEMLSQPKNYAVDGVLYYAKFLKEEYNVLAIAVSGTKKNNFKATTFYWQKGQEYYIEYKKATDIILEPLNYLKMVNGEKIQKQFSLEEIRETAIEMHNKLREVKITEKDKPIFIAGLLIALSSDSFSDNYANFNNFDIIIQNLNFAIITKLKDNNMKIDKVENIINSFKRIAGNPKLRQITLGQDNSILWYIKELECKIKPMMNYSESTIDVLSVFYHEFIKYSGGDGSGLGIVLTPQHITEFMVDIVEVNKNSKVVDICCGSGSFLVSAMVKMLKEANPNEYQQIKNEQLYGIELDNDLFTLAIANMIVRGDG
ncbi:MAG: SAM-dependent methyltransferase, partial [Elusimicrobiota bacterium]|nr:SAM-dependent methyltransferase [Elusimicrobiota bacterium]